jgi:cation diffusion facilitator family transporter
MSGDHEHGHDHGHEHDHPSGIVGVLRSVFAPHSHDHSDSIDDALTASNEGIRALKISLVVLGITAALQVVIVIASGSVALLADTIHNFGDALTAVPLGIAFLLGRRAPTKRYTYGFGRAEDLAGVFVVVMIAASAVIAAYEAIDRLLDPRDVEHVPWVVAAGIIGFAGNELVAVYRIRVGRRIGSAALVADGLHARTDGLTSLAVVVGAIGAGLGWQLADPIVGLVITVAILAIVRSAARDIYRRLMDAVDPELVDEVAHVLGHVDGVEDVEVVRIRWIGHELRAEIDLVADASLSLVDAHAVAERAHHRLLHDVPRLSAATIHVNPSGDGHHDETAHHDH